MYIIDKNKDYYDYMKGMGVDKSITYDRRGSIVLSEQDLLNHVIPSDYHRRYRSMYAWDDDSVVHFVVEIGDTQYLIRISDLKFKTVSVSPECYAPISGHFELVRTFQDHKHYFEKEISIVPARKKWMWRSWKTKRDSIVHSYSELDIVNDKVLSNPIMKDTSIASLISPQDVWVGLMNYISSKYNDKTVAIQNTDVDKLTNHGFDKKTSFRHPVKL